MSSESNEEVRTRMTESDATGSTLDVAACASEPIHVPGAIQPHGLLLVADPVSLEVVAGAGRLEGRLDPD
jgi:light-regulated signal transduction histidine kinase (bacteriophytochrome)